MDYEKKYKEALERAKGLLEIVEEDKVEITKEDVKSLFHELRESEDERINKAIFKALAKKEARDVLLAEGVQVSDALDWLEKQKEQKPVEWSEEDEEMIQDIIASIDTKIAASDFHEMENWLKSLRPSWKPSKEEMEALDVACSGKLWYGEIYLEGLKRIREQLKKL